MIPLRAIIESLYNFSSHYRLISLYIPLFLIIIFIFYNYKTIKKEFFVLSKKEFLVLILIFLIGLSLRGFIAPKTHYTFFDEDGYLDTAKNIALYEKPGVCTERINGECIEFGNFFKNIGFSFILSLFFKIFRIIHY